MSQDDVITQVTTETVAMFRVSAQVGRWLADRRRHALHEAQAASERQRRAVATAVETERRLAEPVYRRALDERFWKETSQEEAALVYGTATRFATIDPLAAAAARRCETEASQRWGLDLREGEHEAPAGEPVTSDQVDTATVEAVAPAVAGEHRDWKEAVEASAAAARAEVAGDGHERQERAAETVVSTLESVIEDHPEVDRVRAALDGQDLELTALDAQGQEVEAASAGLHDAVTRSASPRLVTERLAGRSWSRAEFRRAVSTPLMRAASQARHEQRDTATGPAGGRRTTQSAPEWDSTEARDAWASDRLAEGLPPDAVRAARTGDMVLHRPPSEATRPSPQQGPGRRPPAATQGKVNRHSL